MKSERKCTVAHTVIQWCGITPSHICLNCDQVMIYVQPGERTNHKHSQKHRATTLSGRGHCSLTIKISRGKIFHHVKNLHVKNLHAATRLQDAAQKSYMVQQRLQD